MKSEYTIIGAEEKQRTNKTAVVAIIGFFVLAAVVGLASVSGLSKGELNVRNNVQLSSELKDSFKTVCTNVDQRYVVAVFYGDKLVPCLMGPATDHWENDFKSFQAAIDRCVDLSTHGIAFGIYNNPVWKTNLHDTFTNIPTFVDYVAPGVDMSELYWAGTYLGATKLASSCASAQVSINEHAPWGTMETFCEKCGAGDVLEETRCQSIQDFECPYAGEGSPCFNEACIADIVGAQTFASMTGSFSETCCTSIEAWCKDQPTKTGCNHFSHKTIFTHHCDAAYIKPVVSDQVLHPVLVAEQAAAAAAAAAAAEAPAPTPAPALAPAPAADGTSAV